MADYHAVLKRTLSGFNDPKPELRTKLYERARTTIARQLENRTPPLSADAIQGELNKLETAIASIEHGYNPDVEMPVEAPQQPTEAVSQPPMAETVEQPVQQETVHDTPAQSIEDAVAVEPDPADPVLEELALPSSPAPEPLMSKEVQEAPVAPAIVEETPNSAVSDPVHDYAPEQEETLVNITPSSAPELPEEHVQQELAPDPVAEDTMDQWAKEFMAAQNEAPAEAQIPEVSTAPELPVMEEPVIAASTYEAPVFPDPAPPVSGSQVQSGFPPQEDLTIPPAAGFGENRSRRPQKRGWLKWILLLLLLAILAGIGYFAWTNKDAALEKLSSLSFFEDDAIKPKPVKTISIKPEPEQPDNTTTEQPVPKAENRLGENGEEIATTVPQPTVTPTPATPSQAETSQEANSGGLLIAQNAILYEEGAQASENSIDSGRVVWSVVQEAPATGEPEEPAIRGRIEIPSRNTVLILTIKRNADKALPASHLIELVFAVPDDFSGGAIGQINRFVLKESEQGRGEGLVGVPARIADGIFLIALNNLEEAKNKNESLLQSRDWIDIPMQYRTGRRALMTIEKGVPGDNVFKEVFDAWSKL